MRYFLIAAAAGLLSACVTAVGTPYERAASAKAYGYEDVRIEDNRYRVVFRGDGATPVEVVEDYALLRAAELTLDNGYDWFRVVSRDVNGRERGGVGIGAGVGTGSYGRRSGVNVGVGGNLGKVGARRFFTARLEILCGAGQKPDDGEVYDARSVASSVRGRINDAYDPVE